MCRSPHFAAAVLLSGFLLPTATAQVLSANYALTAPVSLPAPEEGLDATLFAFGPLRLGASASGTGTGLSLAAGEHWFGRIGFGRGVSDDVVSVGGGYRFTPAHALSMQVTRQLGQDRLGLAVRYDGSRAYLRLAYEMPGRTWTGPGDSLRFSAGLRF